jgi:hypothetical protein
LISAQISLASRRDQTLSAKEKAGIDIRAILEAACAGNFSNPVYSIWGNSLREINEHGPRYPDRRQVADYVAIYNFFLRPGLKGKSLKVAAEDVAFANQAFRLHYADLRPSAVIFLSRLAYRYFQRPKSLAVPVIVTPHPGSSWWNQKSKKYGSKRGRDILADFIKTTTWPESQSGQSKANGSNV